MRKILKQSEVLDLFVSVLQGKGEELVLPEEKDPTERRRPAATKLAKSTGIWRIWLTPTAADLRWGWIWTAKTAAGEVCRVVIRGYERRQSGRRRWYGINPQTGGTVWIKSVLKGSKR